MYACILPELLVSDELLNFEHQPLMDDSLAYEDDQQHHLFCDSQSTHQSQGRLHNASPVQFQYHDDKHCMWLRKQVQLDYAGDIGPS